MKEQQAPTSQEVDAHIQLLSEYRHQMKPPLTNSQIKQFDEELGYRIVDPTINILASSIVVSQSDKINKMLAYTFQICNLKVISRSVELLSDVFQRLIETVRKRVAYGLNGNVKKHCLIFSYNYLKNQLQPHQITLNLIMNFASSVIELSLKPQPNPIPITTELQQLQWLIYIIEYLNQKHQNTIKQIYSRIAHPTNAQFLKLISLLMGKVLEDKSTTEIVRGYSCHIPQIREMYYKESKLYFRISQLDYFFIIELFKQKVIDYKQAIRELATQQIQDCKTVLYHCLAIFNCVVYFGGYSCGVQKITVEAVIDTLLELLQVSFLIYEVIVIKNKKTQLENVYKANLSKILGKQANQLQLSESMLGDFQLVGIVRLLANLVHINKQAVHRFQNHVEYFRIILSLTHEDPKQLTMKNWAIVFLRNISEQSQILRGELQKTKINIKVENPGQFPNFQTP